MHNYRKLSVWYKAIKLVTVVYKMTAKFTSGEKYGLSKQMKRCSISIPSNIAEGAGRNSKNEFRHFLGIAMGSGFELETQVEISKELEFIDSTQCKEIIGEVKPIQKMLYRLIKKNT